MREQGEQEEQDEILIHISNDGESLYDDDEKYDNELAVSTVPFSELTNNININDFIQSNNGDLDDVERNTRGLNYFFQEQYVSDMSPVVSLASFNGSCENSDDGNACNENIDEIIYNVDNTTIKNDNIPSHKLETNQDST